MEHFGDKSPVECVEAESSTAEPPAKQQKMSDITPEPLLRYLLYMYLLIMIYTGFKCNRLLLSANSYEYLTHVSLQFKE